MVVYLIATMISILFAHWAQIHPKLSPQKGYLSKRSILFVLSALPLFLVSALRWDVGTDFLPTYARSLGKGYSYELIIKLLDKFLTTHQIDVQWFFVITSAWIATFVWISIWQQGVSFSISIYFYVTGAFYFFGLNGIRQMMAMSVCLFSVRFIKERRFVAFFLCVWLASLIHNSAWVFLLAYICTYIHVSPILALLSGPLTVGLSFVLKPYLYQIISYTKYQIYFTSVFAEDGFEFIFFGVNFLVLIFVSVFYNICKNDKYFQIYYHLNWLALCAIALSGVIPLMKRVQYYFSVTQIMILPLVLQKIGMSKRKDKICWIICVMIAFFLQVLIGIGFLNKNGVLPYHWWFER